MVPELLHTLLSTPSVSGTEEELQRHALAALKPLADRQYTDIAGNAVSVIHPDAPCRVMLSAHADEIGFRVTHIQDDGMIRVQEAGGVQAGLYIGAAMQILHECEEDGRTILRKVNGVGVVTDDLLKNSGVKDSDLVIDIGAADKEEALKAAAPGDPVCADTSVRELLHDRVTCRALDDKAGVYVILEAAKRAVQRGASCGIYVHTSVGEETTGVGGFTAAVNMKPSCCIAVDVTWASDCPGTDPAKTGDVRLGKGPVLCLSGMVNKKMNRLLKQTAERCGIPVQYEIASGRTSTDGDTVAMSGAGVPLALVSVPLRYMHSSAEVADLNDLENCIQLISEFLLAIDADFDYRPLEEEVCTM